ncbi:Radical S-adenosyl methionine domain-containing protein 2, partial [Elasticomyces elasticus]
MILSAIFGRSQSDVLTILVVSIAVIAIITRQWKKPSPPTVPVSVNYHFTRKCNKTCGFCFHTEKSSFVESKENAQRGLRLLKEAGMRKVNFAGGEPFLYPKFLGEL